jgi:phosphinothricin acetyltransferase
MGADPLAAISARIRVATVSDAAAVVAIYAPLVKNTAISFETEPPAAAEMAERVAATLPTHPWLVAERDGMVAGYAYAGKHRERSAYRWLVDVTAYVDERSRRVGVGWALYGELLATLRRQGFHAAFAGIALPNAASIALHEALGFRKLGVYQDAGFKNGQWHDVGWWQLRLSAGGGIPQEPIAFAALPGRA